MREMAERNTVVGIDLLVAGALIASMGYLLVRSTAINAFGFSLATVGAVVLLVVPEDIARPALSRLLADSTANLEALLEETGLRARAYYIPSPEGLKSFVSGGDEGSNGGAEITADELRTLARPPLSLIIESRGRKGLLLTPPGATLVREAALGAGDDPEEAVRTVVVETSGLAKGARLVQEGTSIKLELNSPVSESRTPYYNRCLGTLATSVAACAIARVLGSPIRLMEEQLDGDRSFAVFRLFSEEASKEER